MHTIIYAQSDSVRRESWKQDAKPNIVNKDLLYLAKLSIIKEEEQ